jgi:hypothetical protein
MTHALSAPDVLTDLKSDEALLAAARERPADLGAPTSDTAPGLSSSPDPHRTAGRDGRPNAARICASTWLAGELPAVPCAVRDVAVPYRPQRRNGRSPAPQNRPSRGTDCRWYPATPSPPSRAPRQRRLVGNPSQTGVKLARVTPKRQPQRGRRFIRPSQHTQQRQIRFRKLTQAVRLR